MEILVSYQMYIICIIQFVHFLWYVINVRKKYGYLLDFWTYVLIVYNVVFYFLLYPFAKSTENENFIGDALSRLSSHVDQAFLIVTVGYIGIWAGKYFYLRNVKLYLSPDIKIWKIANPFKRIINSKNALLVLFIMFLPAFLFVIKEALLSQNIFDVRSKLGESNTERPFYNVAMSMYPFFIGAVGTLYLLRKKIKYLFMFLLLLGFSFVFGSRGAAFTAVAQVLFLYVGTRREKIGWLSLSITGIVLIVLIIAFGIMRGGIDSLDNKNILFTFLYGNTFSDLRDFAWFLSYWDDELILGKTYLSGLLSFIPSGLLDFRSIWSLGKVTTRFTGLTEGFHGGLRITLFGESYINFGIIGVVLFSFTFGYLLESVNRRVMTFISRDLLVDAFAMMLMSIVLFSIMITASFFTLYVMYMPVLFLTLCLVKKEAKPASNYSYP